MTNVDGAPPNHGGEQVLDAFLSYRSTHRSLAFALKSAIEAQWSVTTPARIWLDAARDGTLDSMRGIEPGDPIWRRIVRAIAQSRALVALVSNDYFASEACCRELELAYLSVLNSDADSARILIVCPRDEVHLLPLAGLRNLRAEVLGIDAWTASAEQDAADPRLTSAAESVIEYLTRLRQLDAAPLRLSGLEGADTGSALHGRSPPRAHRYFVGRLRECWQIQDHLERASRDIGSGRAVLKSVTLVGLPGIGKSALARHFCDRWGLGYPGGAFWLNMPPLAARRTSQQRPDRPLSEALRDELRPIAAALGLPMYDKAVDGDVLLREAISGELRRRGRRFLWIVNAIQPGLTPSDIEPWLAPQIPEAHQILITVADADALVMRYGAGEPLVVRDLPPEDSVALLEAKMPRTRLLESDSERRAALCEIVSLVGGFPLALEASMHWVGEGPYKSASQFVEINRGGVTAELDRIADQISGLPPDHRLRIARAFELVFNSLRPDEAKLVAALAVCEGLDVSMSMLGAVLALGEPPRVDTIEGIAPQALAAIAKTEQCLAKLQTSGLVEPREVATPARVSRGTALVIRSTLHARNRYDSTLDKMATLTRAAFQHQLPIDRKDAEGLIRLGWLFLEAAPQDSYVASFANYLHERTQFREAASLWKIAEEARSRTFGPEHHETLSAKHNRALAISRTFSRPPGDFTMPEATDAEIDCHREATNMLQEVLDTARRTCGPEHEFTLAVLTSLSRALSDWADVEGPSREDKFQTIRSLLEPSVDAIRRVLGPNSAYTADALTDLGVAMRQLEDTDAARQLLEEALEVASRTDGPASIRATRAQINLGPLLGDAERGLAMFSAALDAWLKPRDDET